MKETYIEVADKLLKIAENLLKHAVNRKKRFDELREYFPGLKYGLKKWDMGEVISNLDRAFGWAIEPLLDRLKYLNRLIEIKRDRGEDYSDLYKKAREISEKIDEIKKYFYEIERIVIEFVEKEFAEGEFTGEG